MLGGIAVHVCGWDCGGRVDDPVSWVPWKRGDAGTPLTGVAIPVYVSGCLSNPGLPGPWTWGNVVAFALVTGSVPGKHDDDGTLHDDSSLVCRVRGEGTLVNVCHTRVAGSVTQVRTRLWERRDGVRRQDVVHLVALCY